MKMYEWFGFLMVGVTLGLVLAVGVANGSVGVAAGRGDSTKEAEATGD